MASDKTKVDLPRDYKIPELFPLEQDKKTRLTIPTRDKGLDPRLNVYSNEGYATGSPMDYMDAPAMAGVNFIRRYSATNPENVRKIYKNGLLARMSDDNVVYTTVNKGGFRYNPEGEERAIFEVRIPKDEYKKMSRATKNPSHEGALGWEDVYEMSDDVHDIDPDLWLGDGLINKSNVKQFFPVQKHGRTDIFMDDIKPEWLVPSNDVALREVEDLESKKFLNEVGAEKYKKYMEDYEKEVQSFYDERNNLLKQYDWDLERMKVEDDGMPYETLKMIQNSIDDISAEYPKYFNSWKELLDNPEELTRLYEGL